MDFNALFQAADWKNEKHSPLIEIKKEEDGFMFILVTVGKEIAHPNQTNHHISWISLFFVPDGEKFPLQVGRVEFSAHGESANGPDTSTVYTAPSGMFALKTQKAGTLIAFSYCNIHGLWRSEAKLTV